MVAAILRPRHGSSVADLRQRLAQAVEDAIAALDAIDGDPDLEDVSEDEGAQCDDEGYVELDDDGRFLQHYP